jgi:hypothetical protein
MQIFPLFYFAPIPWYRLVNKNNFVSYDIHEYYIPQTFRNRCCIYTANGIMNLSIPVKKSKSKIPYNEVLIAYNENWMNLHWRAIQSAYGKCAYFEFFSEEIKALIYSEEPLLFRLNENILNKSCQWFKIKTDFSITPGFTDYSENDFRLYKHHWISPSEPEYFQAFSNKLGFIPNLSILDFLLQNGPRL